MSGWSADVMPKIDAAIAELGVGSLHAEDRVSIYMLDCRLATASGRMEADPMKLTYTVDELMTATAERRAQNSGCGRRVHLWDTLLGLSKGLAGQPGRRAILAITDGKDGGSVHKWQEALVAAQESSVTVIGLSYLPPAYVRGPMMTGMGRSQLVNEEDPFRVLCELSGGMLKKTSDNALQGEMQWFVDTLRERYIVEFPRPSNSRLGRHEIVVRVEKSPDLYIRPAGLSFPMRSQTEVDGPTTIKVDDSKLPTLGNRRTMTPH
jgi:hypothetical protein